MNDELDPGLKRLFAETAEHPADEAFVSAVTRRTSRERRIIMLLRPLAAGLLAALILGALAMGLAVALNEGRSVVADVAPSWPIGWTAGLALAFAGAVLVRSLAPVVARMRP
ncbi:MAG TPA: hypothetical protein VHX64_04855 [Caulobacteraceae bacterium]|nr:hypothetical protein [Caulobacteraceae bacterium]